MSSSICKVIVLSETINQCSDYSLIDKKIRLVNVTSDAGREVMVKNEIFRFILMYNEFLKIYDQNSFGSFWCDIIFQIIHIKTH